MNHATHGRHIAKVTPGGQGHIVLPGRVPANPVIGGIEIAPTLGQGQVGQVNRCPGVRSIAAAQARHTGLRLGEHIAADIAGRQTQAAQAGNENMGEILAHPLALGQRLQSRGVDHGALALVHEIGMHALHQLGGRRQQAPAWRKAGPGIGHKAGIQRGKGRGENEIIGSIKVGARAVTKQFAHRLPAQAAAGHSTGLGTHHAARHHFQRRMGCLQRKEAAAVAVDIGASHQACRARTDVELVAEQQLRPIFQGLQIRHVLGGLYPGGIVVAGAVGDLQPHGVPTLCLLSLAWVK